MFFAVSKQTGWLFYRACVTLRRILAARKRPVVRRIRKAALLVGMWCVASVGLADKEESQPLDQSMAEPIRPISALGTSIAPPPGELPADAAQLRYGQAPLIAAESIGGRGWLAYAYFWQAPALRHRPLYFEEPNLERYGHNAGCVLQPLVSGAHFFSAVPALPLRLALRPPHSCSYSLGHGRPGSNAGWRRGW